MEEPTPSIVFFDGLCGFCDRCVTYLFSRDHAHKLRFAPLQGKTAAELLPEQRRTDLDTMVLLKDSVVYEKSAAALEALVLIGGIRGLFARFALLVPRFIRDLVYEIIAKNRYKIFGKYDTCRLPSPDERAYFFD